MRKYLTKGMFQAIDKKAKELKKSDYKKVSILLAFSLGWLSLYIGITLLIILSLLNAFR